MNIDDSMKAVEVAASRECFVMEVDGEAFYTRRVCACCHVLLTTPPGKTIHFDNCPVGRIAKHIDDLTNPVEKPSA